MTKIVLANRYFHPDQSATSRMVSSLAFSLAEQGVAVTAIASRHYHNRGDVVLPARETVRGVEIRRLWSSGFGRAGLAGRAADYATFHLSAAAWWLANTRRGDICVTCTDPPFLDVSSGPSIRLRGGRPVQWIMDMFPETAMELEMLRPSSAAGRLALWLRDRSLRRAALVICPTAAMAAHVRSRGVPAARAAVARHWSDGEEIRPVARAQNGLRDEWGLRDAFVVGYSGNFGRAHEFGTLLDAAGLLAAHSGIRFLMIGEGRQRAFVEVEVARRGLGNVIFKPFQPSERLAESLGASDAHLVSLLPSLEHCIVPSKFYGVLAAGRPTIFIGDPEGEIGQVTRSAACGETVRPGDASALAALVLRWRDAPDLRALMGANARRLFDAEYALRHGVARWTATVAPLLAGEAPVAMPAPLDGLSP